MALIGVRVQICPVIHSWTCVHDLLLLKHSTLCFQNSFKSGQITRGIIKHEPFVVFISVIGVYKGAVAIVYCLLSTLWSCRWSPNGSFVQIVPITGPHGTGWMMKCSNLPSQLMSKCPWAQQLTKYSVVGGLWSYWAVTSSYVCVYVCPKVFHRGDRQVQSVCFLRHHIWFN